MKKLNQIFTAKLLALVAMGFLALTFSCHENIQDSPDPYLPMQVIGNQNGNIIPGSFVVVLQPESVTFRKDGDYEDVQAAMRKNTISLLAKYRIAEDKISEVYGSALDGFSVKLDTREFDLLKSDPSVKYIEADRVITINQQGIDKITNEGAKQETPWGISRVGGSVNYSGSNVAWVIDTGIDLNHPDLNVQKAKGFTVFKTGKEATPNDRNGHGTHVAGTIAAINNKIGVVGVAAGAPVIPIKVFDADGIGTYSGVIAGVNWVCSKSKKGDVANMSLSGPEFKALDDAVISTALRGIKFAIAAGNSGDNAALYSPARANGANIYTISSMNSSNVFSWFSNFGSPPVDYCAPGEDVKSTWKGGVYNTISGTSMATPHAAGVLLLGKPKSKGRVSQDPDNKRDPIISR